MKSEARYVVRIAIISNKSGGKEYRDFTINFPLSRITHICLVLAKKILAVQGKKIEVDLYKWEYVPDGECVSQDLVFIQRIIK